MQEELTGLGSGPAYERGREREGGGGCGDTINLEKYKKKKFNDRLYY